MASNFPGGYDSFVRKRDLGDPVVPAGDPIRADHVNELQDAAMAVQEYIGHSNPALFDPATHTLMDYLQEERTSLGDQLSQLTTTVGTKAAAADTAALSYAPGGLPTSWMVKGSSVAVYGASHVTTLKAGGLGVFGFYLPTGMFDYNHPISVLLTTGHGQIAAGTPYVHMPPDASGYVQCVSGNSYVGSWRVNILAIGIKKAGYR